ncbi:uncharacterized protein LOC113332379 [Papaver somniferum]|uniref:uncharacterized protein LOC113332379 n=1 Tax=Papaver somniferum TaxID=3469 RepID=UPI000E704AAA|nr:uncharacterized protein LOC113332379 [Papaver somniferum]
MPISSFSCCCFSPTSYMFVQHLVLLALWRFSDKIMPWCLMCYHIKCVFLVWLQHPSVAALLGIEVGSYCWALKLVHTSCLFSIAMLDTSWSLICFSLLNWLRLYA